MSAIIKVRDAFFEQVGQKRIYRILFCAFVIGLIWIFVDTINNNVSFNLMHDVMCLGLGVIAERMIPWGKDKVKQDALLAVKQAQHFVDEVTKMNEELVANLGEQNDIIIRLVDKLEKDKLASESVKVEL